MAKILKSNILPYLKNRTYLKAKIDELLAQNHELLKNILNRGEDKKE